MPHSAHKTLRLAAALCLIVGAYAAVKLLHLEAFLSAEKLRGVVAEAGPWGPVVFFLLFVAAVVAQIPGLFFVAAAPALFHWAMAWILCLVASNVAVVLNFELVRRVGGQPLAEIERPWLKKLFGALDAHPVRTVAVLRVITVMFPPVTGALALTQISAREHAIGSLVGMVVPVSAILFASVLLLG